MAALSMAILFVMLVLILNTSIYTENLATRGSQIAGGGEAVRYLDAARNGVGGAMDYVNHHNHTSDANPHGALEQNLSAAVSAWNNASGRQFAHRGQQVVISLGGIEGGTRIESAAGDPFTNVSGNADWTLAEDVGGTREFVINVTDVGTLEPFGSGDGFSVNVSDGTGDHWTMNVTEDGGDVVVSVTNGSGGQFNCSAAPDPLWIDVTAGTVDGERCDGLLFHEGIGTPYDLSFDNGDNVTGTYSLVVDNESVPTGPGQHLDDEGNGDPFAAPALYAADVTVTYHSPRLLYNATIRVAPGERGG